MKREDFLNLRQKPFRLVPEEVAFLLGLLPNHIAPLVAAGLLKPLGHPPENGHKYFHLPEVLELAADRRRMVQISDLLVNTWQEKNRRAREAVKKNSLNTKIAPIK